MVALAAGALTYRGTFWLKAVTPPAAANGNTDTGNGTGAGGTGSTGSLPRPDHVVVVVEENHSYDEVLGSQGAGTSAAPTTPTTPGPPQTNVLNQDDYIRQLAAGGASFTSAVRPRPTPASRTTWPCSPAPPRASATTPARPTRCPVPDLGGELLAAGLSFAGYSEDPPSVGFTGDSGGDYARNHNPWSDFADVPASGSLPFGQFPTTADGYAGLPTLSFVVPNQRHDMHSGSIPDADQWVRQNLGGYAQWRSRTTACPSSPGTRTTARRQPHRHDLLRPVR